jgi:N-formylglutamate deformylase
VHDIARATPAHTAVLDGRYTAGYITRHYGEPGCGVHAVQFEMTQCSYMEEVWPCACRPDRAQAVQPHLKRMFEEVLGFANRARPQ